MFNIGDHVTRKSYDHDVVFKIMDIDGETYYLKGVDIRLCADSPQSDLVLYKENGKKDEELFPDMEEFKALDRSEYFYLPGKILHIDSDKEYLDRCMEFYKRNKTKAYGVYSTEEDVHNHIGEYLETYNPDILVITGHDAYYKKRKGDDNYKNTSNFVLSVKEARKYEKAHEKLFIIAGACQSNYEELIRAGANFASSPKRINIHALDPAIIAASLSFADKSKDIDLLNILNKTKYKIDGMGGIITKGSMYVGFPR